jgi:hypothetical protein
MPAPPNFIELQANLKCKDANKTSNADNIHMYAKTAGGGYFYIGKATRNASNIITATSTILKEVVFMISCLMWVVFCFTTIIKQ